MKDGTIAEIGTHEELVSSAGDYNNLISMDKTKKNDKVEESDVKNTQESLIAKSPVLDCIFQETERLDKPTIHLEDDPASRYINEGAETLNYSSWAVLLQYFKVSFDLMSILYVQIVLRTIEK